MRAYVPQVSLISSWCVSRDQDGHGDPGDPPTLAALKVALKNRVSLHDLYFLSRCDIGWYRTAAGLADSAASSSALEFAASLEEGAIRRIGERLHRFLTDHYEGKLVGPRPRIAALATFWPEVSLPPEEDELGLRRMSVRALQNALLLARELGCRHVEVVCGSAVPSAAARTTCESPDTYRKRRMEALASAIADVYSDQRAEELFDGQEVAIPYLSVEVEPGENFLMCGLDEFQTLRDHLKRLPGRAAQYTLLNADLAHFLLIDGAGTSGRQLTKFKELRNYLGHVHIADHARSHASDLVPGVYHFLEEYRPWLRECIVAANAHGTKYSRCIAVELEACNDIHEALRAVAKVRRWLEVLTEEDSKPCVVSGQKNVAEVVTGAILVADLGNSTSTYLASSKESVVDSGAEFEALLREVCSIVHGVGGSVMSFTGDGVIAFFDAAHFLRNDGDRTAAARAARAIAKAVQEMIKTDGIQLTVRIAMHYGMISVPTSGELRDQAIGHDVVLGTRLCDWLSKTVEPACPERSRGVLIGATEVFVAPDCMREGYRRFGKVTFKGFEESTTVYIEAMCVDGMWGACND